MEEPLLTKDDHPWPSLHSEYSRTRWIRDQIWRRYPANLGGRWAFKRRRYDHSNLPIHRDHESLPREILEDTFLKTPTYLIRNKTTYYFLFMLSNNLGRVRLFKPLPRVLRRDRLPFLFSRFFSVVLLSRKHYSCSSVQRRIFNKSFSITYFIFYYEYV